MRPISFLLDIAQETLFLTVLYDIPFHGYNLYPVCFSLDYVHAFLTGPMRIREKINNNGYIPFKTYMMNKEHKRHHEQFLTMMFLSTVTD